MPDKINQDFKAVILDMDGVITRTAHIHAKAWKQMFDEFLRKKNGENFQPLDIVGDYKKYIDGKPRLDGIKSFLKSRNISLPYGNPDEGSEGGDTVTSLGIRKNEYFLRILEKEGIHVYKDALDLIKKWKQDGIKLAVISSSRNLENIMKASGILDLFDAWVDGKVSEKEGLKGKPEPDIFLNASKKLGTDTSQTMVIEDAIAGVQAGKKGKFSLVVGVARNGEEQALKEAGADIVLKDLTSLYKMMGSPEEGKIAEDLPNALENIEEIFHKFGKKKPVLFLDYDGTLSPIVNDPEKALLPHNTKEIMIELAKIIPVGVISGRDRLDIQSKVGINTIIYAGSHGFDITGPKGLDMQYEPGKESLQYLDVAEKHLKDTLKEIKGAQVERKKYAIAVHYRNVAENQVKDVEKAVLDELAQQDKLKKGTGKKVLELKPNLDWHKGKAISWLLEKLGLNADKYIPVFIGDDITDEDALKAIKDEGIGILVGSHDERTFASYSLNKIEEVNRFLKLLNNWLKEKK